MQRVLQLVFTAALALVSTSGAIAKPPALVSTDAALIADDTLALPELTLKDEDGYVVEVTIDGQPVHLQVSLAHQGIVLSQSAAERIGIAKRGRRVQTRLGPKIIDSRENRFDVAIGSVEMRERVAWLDAEISKVADGLINIASLPNPVVSLNLRERHPEDREIQLPTTARNGFAVVYSIGQGANVIDVRPNLEAADTVLTTALGAVFAEKLGGTWDGPEQAYPILYGIARPARAIRFTHPLSINGLLIDRAVVRLRDYQGEKYLPSGDGKDDVITVLGNADRTKAEYFLYLGRDVLGTCARITFTKATGMLDLVCK